MCTQSGLCLTLGCRSWCFSLYFVHICTPEFQQNRVGVYFVLTSIRKRLFGPHSWRSGVGIRRGTLRWGIITFQWIIVPIESILLALVICYGWSHFLICSMGALPLRIAFDCYPKLLQASRARQSHEAQNGYYCRRNILASFFSTNSPEQLNIIFLSLISIAIWFESFSSFVII